MTTTSTRAVHRDRSTALDFGAWLTARLGLQERVKPAQERIAEDVNCTVIGPATALGCRRLRSAPSCS
ncbi:MAG: hypothetical protein ABSH34_11110 [Verrucomicrobiota bacterium]|jgi:hypothetical protein